MRNDSWNLDESQSQLTFVTSVIQKGNLSQCPLVRIDSAICRGVGYALPFGDELVEVCCQEGVSFFEKAGAVVQHESCCGFVALAGADDLGNALALASEAFHVEMPTVCGEIASQNRWVIWCVQ